MKHTGVNGLKMVQPIKVVKFTVRNINIKILQTNLY